MLNISIIGEKPFDLDPTQDISITSTNPALDKDGISRSFTMPFTLPATPRNLFIRRHANRLDARPIAAAKARIRFGPHLISEGILKQTNVGPDREEVQFVNEQIDIWKKMETFKISEILETLDITHPDMPDAEWILTLNAPSTGLTYSIQFSTIGTFTATAASSDPLERDIAGNTLKTNINAALPGFANYINGTGELVLDAALVNTNTITTYNNMVEASVITPGQAALANMVLHVTDSHTTPYDTHAFPCLIWLNFYGPNTIGYVVWDFEERINGFADGTFFENEPYVVTADIPHRWANTVVPMPRVPYILERIRERLGFDAWRGEFWNETDFQSLIVVNNYSLDTIYDDRYSASNSRLNGFALEINLNKHVPELTAADFMRYLLDTFNLELRPQDNSLFLIPNRKQITKPPMDWRDKADPKYTREATNAKGWALTYLPTNDLGTAPIDQLQTITYGAGSFVKKVIPSMYHRTDYALRTYGNAKMPQFQQQGNSTAINAEQKRSTMPLLMLFDRGLQPTSGGKLYPMAVHDNTNIDNDVVGDWSLDIVGDNGLYALWHKGHIELIDCDIIKMTFSLSQGEIQQVQTWANARARVYNPMGEFTGVVKVITVRMNDNGVGAVSVEMLRQ